MVLYFFTIVYNTIVFYLSVVLIMIFVKGENFHVFVLVKFVLKFLKRKGLVLSYVKPQLFA